MPKLTSDRLDFTQLKDQKWFLEERKRAFDPEQCEKWASDNDYVEIDHFPGMVEFNSPADNMADNMDFSYCHGYADAANGISKKLAEVTKLKGKEFRKAILEIIEDREKFYEYSVAYLPREIQLRLGQ